MKISRFADRTGTVYRFLIAFLVYLIGGFPTLAYALPQGGTIASGAGTIDTSGSSLTVNQTTSKIIINWESFSIGNNESVIFLQPDSTSSALNNVLGSSRTVVEGNLSANGQIVLSNPNGIFISPTANVNVASLIASTLKISEQDFLDGLYKFSQDPSKPLASILNEGKIRASDFAALIAPSVDNKGVVIANLGTVGLVSGQAVTVDFVGDNLIKFTVNEPVEGQVLDKDGNLISDSISNSGSIQANGGQVILSAKNASSIIKNVINMDGVIEAKTVSEKNGRIFLGGGDQGTVRVAGTLNASGEEPGEQGGEITVEGADVIVAKGSIQAKGTDAKGGNITITGTDWVNAGGTMDVSGETGGNVNITTGGLSLAEPILAKGSTGQGGNININTLFKSWEVVSAMLDVSGASGGKIKHFAGQQIVTSGKYLAIGTDGIGGSIDVTANTIKFMSNTIDASGTMGGGRIRLGGEYQGGKNLAVDEILNANFLFMTDAANITAKTTGADGDGGRIIVWGDQEAVVLGQIDVRPGTQSGAGGFVEVSSGDTLTFGGHVKTGIDERTGTLLLDPKNITIEDTRVFDPSSYMIGYGYSSDDNDIDLSESKLAFATLTVGNTAEALTVGETITGGTSGATGVVVLGEAGSTTVTYTVTSGTFQNETITGGTSSVAKVVSAVTASTTYRGNDDGFGTSVSLHGKWLAVGGSTVENLVQDQESEGAVFLYSYSDTGLSGGTLQAIIGDGYTGGNNLNEPLERKDYFGTHVSLFTNGKGNGQLVVAAMGEDGFEDALNSSDGFIKGALYLYSFNDVSFAGLTREARIGAGATGTNEIDLSAGIQIGFDADRGSKTPGADQLSAVSLSEGADGSTRLAVGVRGSDGFNNAENNAGDVLLFTFADPATLTVGSTGEDLTVGETITGGDSGATGVVVLGARDTTTVTYTVTSGTFQNETITGGTSSVSKDVSAVTTGKDFSGGALAAVIGSGYDGTYDGADGNATGNRAKDLDLATPLEVEDFFGDGVALDYDSTLNRHRLAVLSRDDRGKNNAQEQGGVYLFTFTDDSFSGGSHVGTIGHSYDTTASDFDFQITSTKNWGGAMTSVALDGNYLAVGAARSTVTAAADGQVELFSFTNNSTTTQFNNIVNEGTLCTGCSSNAQDVEVVPESEQTLAQNDAFGVGVSLDGNRLVVGASGGDGAASGGNGASGEVHIFPLTHYEAADGSVFDNSTAASQILGVSSEDEITIWPSTLVGILSGGTAVVLQANNDITVTDAITVSNASGAGGNLTMQAGRTIDINANITTDDGNLTLTANETLANGVVNAQRDSGNAEINLTGATINTGSGTFTATISAGADKTNSGSADITLNTVTAASLVMTNNGTTAGSVILDSGVLTVSGTSSFTTAVSDGVITLDSTNALTGAVTLSTTGSNGNATVNNGSTALDIAASSVDGAFILTTTAAATVVNDSGLDFGATTVGGALTATATTGDITDSGVLAITGAATFNAANGQSIILDSASTFSGTLDFNAVSGTLNSVTINDSGGLNLQAMTLTGNLNVTANGTVTDSGTLDIGGSTTVTVTADTVTLNTLTNDFTGAVSISQGLHITLKDTNDLEIGTINATGKLQVVAGGAVTQSGAMSVANWAQIKAQNSSSVDQNITLTNASNNFSSVLIPNGANVQLVDAGAIILAASTVTGTYDVTARGAVTDSGVLTITGAATIIAQSSNGATDYAITLDLAGHDFSTISVTGANVELVDENAIVLGASTVSGTYDVTATSGNITNTGNLTITGGATFVTGATGSNIILDQANAFSSWVKMKADTGGNEAFGNIEFVDSGAVTIQTSAATDADGELLIDGSTDGAVGGTLSITATTGNITQGQVLAVTGASTFVVGATGSNIVLDHASNAFSNSVTMKAGTAGNLAFGNIEFVDSAAVKIETSANTNADGELLIDAGTDGAVGGTLSITATTGDITQGLALAVTGATTLVTSADGAAINLDNTSNKFTGALTITTNDTGTDTAGDVTIYAGSGAALDFGASTIDGDLIARSGNATGITDSGVVTVRGTSSFQTTAADADISLGTSTLGDGNGADTITLNTTGSRGDATLDNGTTIVVLGTSAASLATSVGGNLTLQTGNASGITDSATVTVGGRFYATTDANNGVINMGTLNILDGGTIKLTTEGSGDATVVNTCTTCSVGLAFESSTIRGDLIAKADSGNIENVSGNTLTVSLTSSFQTGGSGADITLNETNALTGEVTLNTTGTDGDVTLNGGNTALQLGTSAASLATSVSGDLDITVDAVVTDLDGLTVEGTTIIRASGRAITLDHTSNDFTGAVSVIGAAVKLVDANAIDLGTTTTTGTYQVTATAGGDITDSGTLTIGGAATFTAAGGKNIYLDNKDSSNVLFGIHTFSGAVTFASGGTLANVTVRNSGAFDFGAALTLATGGNLILTAGGTVTQTGGALVIPGTTTITALDSDVTLTNASNNFTGAVSIQGQDVQVTDSDSLVLGASIVTGTTTGYDVIAGGTVTQAGALDITGVTTISAVDGSSVKQDVTLTNTSNNFRGAVEITGADVGITDIDTLILGTSTVTGTTTGYDVIAGGAVTQAGALTITGVTTISAVDDSSVKQNVTLGNTSNAFTDAVEITGQIVEIDGGTTKLKIGTSIIGGDLTLTSGNAADAFGITDSGTVTVGGNLSVTNDVNNGDIDMETLAVTGTISLVTSGSGNATVANTTGLKFADVRVAGNLAATASNGAVTQRDTSGSQLGEMDIDGTTTIAVSSANDVTLDIPSNDFTGAVSITGSANDITIKDINAINLGAVAAARDYSVSAGGAITDSGAQVITRAATFVTDGDLPTLTVGSTSNAYEVGEIITGLSSGATGIVREGAADSTTVTYVATSGTFTTENIRGGTNSYVKVVSAVADVTILLDHPGNSFGSINVTGNAGATINAAGAVVLTGQTLLGNLTVTAGGHVTDTGTWDVTGMTTITAQSGGTDYNVTLGGETDDFKGAVSITGANVVITDANSIVLGKTAASGFLMVTAGGTVTQSSLAAAKNLAVTGATTITGTDITLNNTANNFQGAVGVTTRGSDVVLVDTNAIELGASTVTGTYDVTAGGPVTQSGALAITRATTITAQNTAGTTNYAVTLTEALNDFTGAVSVIGAAVQLVDANAIDLGTTTTTGTYQVTATAGGDITDSGTLTIGGAATFTAAGGKNIYLDNKDSSNVLFGIHTFSGAVTFASGGTLANVTVRNSGAFDFGAALTLATGGNLILTAGGTVTQTGGALVIPGTTTILSSGSNVTLSNASNDFTGAVSITGNTVTLVDANAIDLGASTVTGNYAVTATAGGGITDSGVLNITGTSTFTAAGGQSILLDKSSTFTSAVTFASGGTLAGVSITDTTDFVLKALTLSGNLVVASGGSITQSGVLDIEGTTTLVTTAQGGTIDLATNGSGNAFTRELLITTNDNDSPTDGTYAAHVTIDGGTTNLIIGTSTIDGNLTLTSGAAAGITDIGTVTVGGNLNATTDANSGIINMVKLAVDGSISLTTHGSGNATIVNDAGLNFATSTIGGDLTATATTLNIVDSGRISVTGATIITLGTNPVLSVSGATTATDIYGLTITLDTANNLFTGGITLHYENVLPVVDNSDINLARQVTFAELDFAIDQNITKIYGSYEEMQDDILWMYKLFRDRFPEQEQSLEVVRQPQPNQVKIRKIKANTNKNNESEGKEL